jgi:hypothetical protein
MKKSSSIRKSYIPLVLIFALVLGQGFVYGGLKIEGLTFYPSMPEPGQEVILRVKISLTRPLGAHIIRLLDVLENEITFAEIPEDFNSKDYIDIAFVVPEHPGRYNYNVRVNIGDENKFINIPITSEPVASAIVEKMYTKYEHGRLMLSFFVRNNGNKALQNLKISGIINPGMQSYLSKDISEVLMGEEHIAYLETDAMARITMGMNLDENRWLSVKNGATFFVGVKISGMDNRPYWKIEKYKIKNGTSIIVPLHGVQTHAFYSEHGIEIFPKSSLIYQELNQYREQLINGSINEDSTPDLVYQEGPLLYIHHFLDYDDHPFHYGLYGTGLHIPLITPKYVESSYEKAIAYWNGWTIGDEYYPGVIELYLGIGLPLPDKITAYEYLGRICHLIEDSLTPAHVHSDIHGIVIDDDEFEEVFEPGIDPDTVRPRYEKYDENSAVWAYWRDYIGNRNILDLSELFTKMNQHADYFPSDDYEGDDLNFSNPWNIPKLYSSDIIYYDWLGVDHFKLPGMQKLADWLSPLNVMSCASIYKFFWDNIHLQQLDDPHGHSGQ